MRTPPPSPLAFVAFLAVASAFARTLACPGLRTARRVELCPTEAERRIIDVSRQIPADRRRLLQERKAGPVSYRLFEMLPMMPRFTVEHVRRRLKTTFPTASAAVKALEELGVVTELPGQKKNRIYRYQTYMDLLSR